MAKDPAFLFYPGDYLRDTQCLSSNSQVAYDRIMCEHMRNISEDMINIVVSKRMVDFFTKRLSDEEKEELFCIVDKVGNGYQIEWVAQSLAKRKSYSVSRSENRTKKVNKHMLSHDKHMENANENVIKIEFDKWWKLYNKKTGKTKSLSKWLKLKQPDRDKCLEVVLQYVLSKPDKQYRLNPLTYLNGDHWDDEIIQDNKSKPSRPQFKTATGGGLVAYCSKCHQVQFPKDKWAIEAGSTCHGADFLNEKPKAK